MVQFSCIGLPLFWTDQTFLNAFGAAVGGFAGVIVFFLFRLAYERIQARAELLRTYSCAHDQNIGDLNEYEGQLLHHHGRRIYQESDLHKIGRKRPVWEWTRTPCGKEPRGDSVIYGPYTTDFSEPAEYEVVFSIRGIGFSSPEELQHDPIVLELDVARTTAEYVPTAAGIARFDSIITVSRYFVRAKDLACADWCEFPLRFYASGEGVWEYRVQAYDGTSPGRRDHLAIFGENIRLLFDCVKVRRTKKMTVPWN